MKDEPRTPSRLGLTEFIDGARELLAAAVQRPAGPPPPADRVAHAGDPEAARRLLRTEVQSLLKTLAAVATAVWRVRSRLANVSQDSLPPELRHLPRHVDAAWDALTTAGFVIADPTGQRYVPGMAVNPLAFQPVEGVDVDLVAETLKPSVQYRSILIQRADVIVARPVGTASGTSRGAVPAPGREAPATVAETCSPTDTPQQDPVDPGSPPHESGPGPRKPA